MRISVLLQRNIESTEIIIIFIPIANELTKLFIFPAYTALIFLIATLEKNQYTDNLTIDMKS